VLRRIADRRRRQQEHRLAAVKTRDPLQAPHHVGEVRAEHAAVHVQLVDHHVAQLGEEARPVGVVREDPGVQHVGVGQQHRAALARGPARVDRRVAVIGDRAALQAGFAQQRAQRGFLIARQRLGRKEVERARRRILRQRLEHGQVVTKALARRGRRGDHHVAAGQRVRAGVALMRVQLANAARRERILDARREARRDRHERGRPRGQALVQGDVAEHAAARLPLIEDGRQPAGDGPGLLGLGAEALGRGRAGGRIDRHGALYG